MAGTLYKGSLYKVLRSDGSYDIHYFRTHVDAIEELVPDDKYFVTADQREFLAAMKDNSAAILENFSDTAYADLITRANVLYNMYTSDGNSIIDKLQEILSFVTDAGVAEIPEDYSLEDFITGVTASLEAITTNITPATDNTKNIGATANRFKDAYFYNIAQLAQLKVPDFSHIKNQSNVTLEDLGHSVVSQTAPTAASYSRTAMQEGLLWIDTSGGALPTLTQGRPSIIIQPASSDTPTHLRVDNDFIRKSYFNAGFPPRFSGAKPIVEFDTAWGRMAICIYMYLEPQVIGSSPYHLFFYVTQATMTGYPGYEQARLYAQDEDLDFHMTTLAVCTATANASSVDDAMETTSAMYPVGASLIGPIESITLPEATIINSNWQLAVPGLGFTMKVDWS